MTTKTRRPPPPPATDTPRRGGIPENEITQPHDGSRPHPPRLLHGVPQYETAISWGQNAVLLATSSRARAQGRECGSRNSGLPCCIVPARHSSFPLFSSSLRLREARSGRPRTPVANTGLGVLEQLGGDYADSGCRREAGGSVRSRAPRGGVA